MEKIADMGSLANILRSYAGKSAMLTFHSVGDTDALASAIVLSKFFRSARVSTPDFITSHSKNILHKLGFNPDSITNFFDEGADVAVLTDVNNLEDCGKFSASLASFSGELLVVDHHSPKTIGRQASVYNDESRNSASSIVFALVELAGIKLTKHEANLLALGIISDSAEFINSTPETFTQVGKLLQISGASYSWLAQLLKSTPSAEERLRSIAELSSAEKNIVSGILFVYGRAGYQANHMAEDAIRVGADVSLFYTISETEISFSARMRPEMESRGIHLGVIMKGLAHMIGGSGGGHPGAAGAYGTAKDRAAEFTRAFIDEVAKRKGPT
ncbi:MAG: DHH family phosphoesterase [Candidatus Micrarchaeota archaeon]|nr:DHH family phosphoesterase [Candidatus Micrarchaeota archaeon]